MISKKLSLCIFLVLIVAQLGGVINAQQCQPPVPGPSPRPNIFTEAQEADLGDAIAEQIQRKYRVIYDDAVTQHLTEIGNRIIRHLPPSNLRFQFFLVDLPTANAFELPGGRIFVSRKLIGITQNEDELAGVISHEIGHLVSRQGSIEMTFLFKEVLNVTSVGDRKDIFDKFNMLIDNVAKNPKAFKKIGNESEKDQVVADQMGVFALAAAGYDPQAMVRFWDRFAETKGKTGNALSDFFGMTSPESKRLREMIKNVGVLPPGCVEARKATATDEFQSWKSAVANYTGLGRKEDLHGVISKLQLAPALRGDVTHLRFSPDGKYILAQDDSGINVLTREPFAAAFRIEAPGAVHAQFTPDSQNILFYNSSLRVERWDVNEQHLVNAYDMVIHKHCMQTALSPEGKLLACMSADSDFQIFDVATSNQVFEKKRFFQPSRYSIFAKELEMILNAFDSDDESINWVNMGFSPDGHYFVIGSRDLNVMSNTNETLLAIDTQTMAQIQFKGPVKKLIAGGFTFTGQNKLVALNREDLTKSAIVSFPSGEIQEQFQLPNGQLTATHQSDYLLIRPAGQYKVGVMRVADKAMIMGGKTSALDAYDKVFVAERKDGELALYSPDKNDTLATVKLPKNALARTRGLAVSTDFRWLAVSERARGAIWDLNTGEMLFNVRGFRGGYFSDDGFFYADFPKFEETERGIAKIDLFGRKGMQTTPVSDKRARQFGPFMLVIRQEKENTRDSFWVMDFRDTKTQELIWSKPFPKESPQYSVSTRNGTIALFWRTTTEAAKEEIKKDPKLAQQLSAAKEKEGNYFLQIYDAKSGKLLGQLIVETGKGSFTIGEVFAIKDHVVVSDSENRVLLYSLATGQQEGKVFGGYATASPATGLLCVENERGQLIVYDLATREKRDQFSFSSPIAAVRFSADGKKLFVLATNQIAYVLDVSKLSH